MRRGTVSGCGLDSAKLVSLPQQLNRMVLMGKLMPLECKPLTSCLLVRACVCVHACVRERQCICAAQKHLQFGFSNTSGTTLHVLGRTRMNNYVFGVTVTFYTKGPIARQHLSLITSSSLINSF